MRHLIAAMAFVCVGTASARQPSDDGGGGGVDALAPFIIIVATDGDDATGTGTLAAPYRTLDRARDRVRTLQPLSTNVEVQMRGGVYFTDHELVLTAQDSGGAHSITYTTYGGENVMIHGGQEIREWQQGGYSACNAGVWWGAYSLIGTGPGQFPDGFRDLYFNNRRLTRSRYPNAGYIPIDQSLTNAAFGRQYTFGPATGPIPGFANGLNANLGFDAEIVVRRLWVSPRQRFQGSQNSGNYNTVYLTREASIGTYWNGSQASNQAADDDPWNDKCRAYLLVRGNSEGAINLCGAGWAGANAHFESDWNFMDAPNEWYLCPFPNGYPQSGGPGYGQLNVILPGNQDPRQGGMVAPLAPKLVSASYITNVHFRGLSFGFTNVPLPENAYAHVIPNVPVPGYNPGQAGHWIYADPIPPGNAHCTGGCAPGSGNGKNILPGALEFLACNSCTIQMCRVGHTGGAGILVSGNNNQIIGTEVFDVAGTGISVGGWGSDYGANYTGNVVSNCHIHEFGVVYHDCVGIWYGVVNYTTLDHNEISHGGYSGISAGWSWSHSDPTHNTSHNSITNNRVHDVMTALNDGAGIYLNGTQPNSLLSGNYVYRVTAREGYTSGGNCVGIYWDEGSDGWTVQQNVIKSSDLVVQGNDTPIFFNGSNALNYTCPSDETWGTGVNTNYIASTDNAYNPAPGCGFGHCSSCSFPAGAITPYYPWAPPATALATINGSGPTPPYRSAIDYLH